MEHENIYVIVPVYKVEPYLERCIDSILAQTYQNFELVLVDDGSPDNCPAICDRYAAEHENITVIHQENGGVSAARNTGLDYAMTHGNPEKDWISFIDSDDFVHPQYLQFLIKATRQYHVNISCCNYLEYHDQCIPTPVSGTSELVETQYFWNRYPSPSVVPWGKLYKLALFMNIRYPLDKRNDDTFTTHQILFQCSQVAWIPDQLCYYYINPNSLSRQRDADLLTQWSEGYEAQAIFFHQHGLITCRNIAARRMLVSKLKAIEQAKKHCDPAVVVRLKADLKRQIHLLQHDWRIRIYRNEEIYAPVFPFLTSCTKTLYRIKKKVYNYISRR